MRRVVITGAAGLVGHNLIARLKNRADIAIVGIDKHPANIHLFRQVHPDVSITKADLAKPGDWADLFARADAVVVNQAQIGGLYEDEFWRNNVEATKHILSAIERHKVPYFVGISSSVVNSIADDFYTRTKTAQEKLFDASEVPHCVLRPTLMFGWFDRKHLGWLRRFMDRAPFFPVPDDGNFTRQPLYVGDFVSVIISAIERHTTGTYDISGLEMISYGSLIRTIHDIVKPRARIVHIPYRIFWLLLWAYACFNRNPPFTTKQLEALVIPETFPMIDWPSIFGVKATPLKRALEETFLDTAYGKIVAEY
jgi:nucleoside-diphosphate-sugar epimerase